MSRYDKDERILEKMKVPQARVREEEREREGDMVFEILRVQSRTVEIDTLDRDENERAGALPRGKTEGIRVVIGSGEQRTSSETQEILRGIASSRSISAVRHPPRFPGFPFCQGRRGGNQYTRLLFPTRVFMVSACRVFGFTHPPSYLSSPHNHWTFCHAFTFTCPIVSSGSLFLISDDELFDTNAPHVPKKSSGDFLLGNKGPKLSMQVRARSVTPQGGIEGEVHEGFTSSRVLSRHSWPNYPPSGECNFPSALTFEIARQSSRVLSQGRVEEKKFTRELIFTVG